MEIFKKEGVTFEWTTENLIKLDGNTVQPDLSNVRLMFLVTVNNHNDYLEIVKLLNSYEDDIISKGGKLEIQKFKKERVIRNVKPNFEQHVKKIELINSKGVNIVYRYNKIIELLLDYNTTVDHRYEHLIGMLWSSASEELNSVSEDINCYILRHKNVFSFEKLEIEDDWFSVELIPQKTHFKIYCEPKTNFVTDLFSNKEFTMKSYTNCFIHQTFW